MQLRTTAATAAAFFCIALLTLSSPRSDASARVGIEPLKLSLPGKALATSAVLTNQDKREITFQAEVFAWDQQDSKDVLTPTRELVVSPPVFRIQPGGKQVIRVGRIKRVDTPETEITYRLVLTEVAPPPGPGVSRVATALRIDMPVLVPPLKPRQALSLDWQAAATSRTDLSLNATNTGNRSFTITRLSLMQQGRIIATRRAFEPVLSGRSKTMTWKDALKEAKPGQGLEILTEFSNRRTDTRPLDLGLVSIVPNTK